MSSNWQEHLGKADCHEMVELVFLLCDVTLIDRVQQKHVLSDPVITLEEEHCVRLLVSRGERGEHSV